ncbi:hypothetical protein H257_08671 [Aphanomyces astaci]|uniref:DDE Tnp4 domain-containing protein n=1 Tax=Aphanomyces astaci TaxID=112090 RepID=W4GDS6_APHAT|nr:hypothetical protein H257_08671 [Aphanomyces astaci]ETV77847.1 hypothetical protein H257_08671 [Aphanomyces astaci]|eukprot:XP_009832957.1 hypothetical protein H257_08671 [Aphanomyces astaci]
MVATHVVIVTLAVALVAGPLAVAALVVAWVMAPAVVAEVLQMLTKHGRAHFNYTLSSMHMAVECAFGRLKERFQVLKGPVNAKTLGSTVTHVMS